MAYTPINWDESTSINPANLNKMDSQIDANEDDIDDIENGNVFELSGNAGGEYTISSGIFEAFQSVFITIPVDKKITIKKVRYHADGSNDFRLRISADTFYTSSSSADEENPNAIIASNNRSTAYTENIKIGIYNNGSSDATNNKNAGWWVSLKLEDV